MGESSTRKLSPLSMGDSDSDYSMAKIDDSDSDDSMASGGRNCGSRSRWKQGDEVISLLANIWDPAHILTRRNAFFSKINEYFIEEKYTDVKIICHNPNRVFKCHRLALAAASEYFDAMFGGHFSESHSHEVVLQDIDGVTFEQVLIFVYQGKVVPISDSDGNVYNLLRASDILRLGDIEDHCIHYLTYNSIPMDCALEIHSFACTAHKVSLIPATSRFIIQHWNHFCQDSTFLQMPLEELRTIFTHFQTTTCSRSREKALLNAILQWVSSTTDMNEDRRSTFIGITQMIQFDFISAENIAAYFDEYFSNHGASCDSEKSDLAYGIKNEKFPLHVYIDTYTKKLKPESRSRFGQFDEEGNQTSILSIYEASKEIDWQLSSTIKPRIEKMGTTALDDRLYIFKYCQKRWRFCSSPAIDLSTDMQLLTLPSHCVPDDDFYYIDCMSSSMSCLKSYIYFCIERFRNHEYGFQYYNNELDIWTPIAAVNEKFSPNIITNDGTQLYMTGSVYNVSNSFEAYDPRIGKLERLDNSGLTELTGFVQSCYHNGRIYIPEDDEGEEYISNIKMSIYDVTAGKWDIQKLKSLDLVYSTGNRLIPYSNKLWLFHSCGESITIQTFDLFLQKWNKSNSESLDDFIKESQLASRNFIDTIVFKPL